LSYWKPAFPTPAGRLRQGTRSLGCAAAPSSSTKPDTMAIRLAICVITALLGLGLGALAPVSAADRPRLPATARRAARHLPVSAEEGAVAAAGRGLPGRPPDLFALGLRGQVVLAAAVAGRNALLRAASAQGPLAVPGARSARTAARAAGGPAGPAARPARPAAALTGLGAARAAAASALAGAALDFDWRAYLAYYPELRAAGVVTEGLARDHYARQCRAEVPLRCARGPRPDVLVRSGASKLDARPAARQTLMGTAATARSTPGELSCSHATPDSRVPADGRGGCASGCGSCCATRQARGSLTSTTATSPRLRWPRSWAPSSSCRRGCRPMTSVLLRTTRLAWLAGLHTHTHAPSCLHLAKQVRLSPIHAPARMCAGELSPTQAKQS